MPRCQLEGWKTWPLPAKVASRLPGEPWVAEINFLAVFFTSRGASGLPRRVILGHSGDPQRVILGPKLGSQATRSHFAAVRGQFGIQKWTSGIRTCGLGASKLIFPFAIFNIVGQRGPRSPYGMEKVRMKRKRETNAKKATDIETRNRRAAFEREHCNVSVSGAFPKAVSREPP